jgi:hypothetical protein
MLNARSLAVVFTLVGCGGEDPGPLVDTDTGTAAGDSSTTDTGGANDSAATDTSVSDVGAPPTSDLNFKADFIGKNGPFYITGTITLPAGAAAGRPVQLDVIRATGTPGNQVGPAGMTKAGSTITFTVTGLQAGDYKIGARVDQTNNGMVNDPGDYIGYARGTVAAPKTSGASADAITVSAPVTGVDFGLGVQP